MTQSNFIKFILLIDGLKNRQEELEELSAKLDDEQKKSLGITSALEDLEKSKFLDLLDPDKSKEIAKKVGADFFKFYENAQNYIKRMDDIIVATEKVIKAKTTKLR